MRGDKRVERIVINKLGPIDYCDFEINDFMIFTGPQASGKSTIAKSIFFFKNIRNLILKQINKPFFSSSAQTLIKDKIELTDIKINKENLKQCA